MNVSSNDLNYAIESVVEDLADIDALYPGQLELLMHLFQEGDIFFTSSTNSGKTLPTVILPDIMKKLNSIGYCYPKNPKVLFLTALNSIQISLRVTTEKLGIESCSINTENASYMLENGPPVILISPESLKQAEVTKALLRYRSDFVLKVVDECHLGKTC